MRELQIPIESTTLENGLRVVVSPDRAAPVVTVGVYYNIGFRLEPQRPQRLRASVRAHDVSGLRSTPAR